MDSIVGTETETKKASGKVLFSRGIFSTERAAWIGVVLYTLLLYSTLTVTYDFYIWVFNRIGRDSVSIVFTVSYSVLGLVLLVLLVWKLPRRGGAYLAFLMIVLVTGYALYLESVPANRIHFLQYAPLTVLVLDALRFRCRDRYIYVWVLAVVALIGTGDEFLQGLFPDRRFDPHDVVLNSLAGALTLSWVGWVQGEKNYPWG